MLAVLLSASQILCLVVGHPAERYLIDSRPLLFEEEAGPDTQVVNATLVLKKKEGPVYYTGQVQHEIINNHHIDAEGVVWKRPYRPAAQVFSNHKGFVSRKRATTSTPYITTFPPYPAFESKPAKLQPVKKVISNHNPSAPIRSRPHQSSSVVSIVDSPTRPPTDIVGDRVKRPDTIKSAPLKVLDAPSHLKTTIKHNKIIVIQKRVDKPALGNFSVAPVMDEWSNIPIPSTKPVKWTVSRPSSPVMPFLSSLLNPLLNKPLTPSAVNSGMQGIKAMQGFLRNSLMGAMFCFLPSAFIALSLTATQRAQLRKIPEVDDMMVFCKKCLENLKEYKELANSKELHWLENIS